jgi:hypothetical protein
MTLRGKALLYPARQRCFRCRRVFTFGVIDGLYCSTLCAMREPTSTNPTDWPREHYARVPHSDRRKEKRHFFSLAEAQVEAKRWSKDAYLCIYCGYFHIGSKRPEENSSKKV